MIINGVGVGLRACHYSFIENNSPDIPWFEVLTDNYLTNGGPGLSHLDKIRESYPMTLHGVGLSLGSMDPINHDYLKKLSGLKNRIEPFAISDHLSWTSLSGRYFHELFPLPYTEEALWHMIKRIHHVQDFLGQQILIENPSTYVSYNFSTLREWEFLAALAEETGCGILLDINNLYVSARNNTFNEYDYLTSLSQKHIAQLHLAGYEEHDKYLLDTHGSPVHAPVWELYAKTLELWGFVPTVIEWDTDIPDFPTLQEEANKATRVMENTLALTV